MNTMTDDEAQAVIDDGFYVRICKGDKVAILTFDRFFWDFCHGLTIVPYVEALVKKHVTDFDSFTVYEKGVPVRGHVRVH